MQFLSISDQASMMRPFCHCEGFEDVDMFWPYLTNRLKKLDTTQSYSVSKSEMFADRFMPVR